MRLRRPKEKKKLTCQTVISLRGKPPNPLVFKCSLFAFVFLFRFYFSHSLTWYYHFLQKFEFLEASFKTTTLPLYLPHKDSRILTEFLRFHEILQALTRMKICLYKDKRLFCRLPVQITLP